MPKEVALRHRAAVEVVAAQRPRTVLEIGCGQGLATELLLQAVPRARIVAVDRSPKMVAAVAAKLADAVESGRLVLHAAAIESAELGRSRFDAVVAVNVDLGRRLGDRWPELLRPWLRSGGLIALAFEAPPGAGARDAFTRKATAVLARAGFESEVTRREEQGRAVSVLRAWSA